MIIHTTRILLLTAAVMLFLSACGPSVEEAPEPAATVPGLEEAPEAPVEQPTVVSPSYPAPDAAAPAEQTLPADYPAPPTLAPTVDPYPGGLVWVIRPVGFQCEEGTLPGYGDLREATSTLTAAGVSVAQAEMTELMVTASCGSPTSAHYHMQIAAEDLQTALSLDWTQE